jgi:hypothetical protein
MSLMRCFLNLFSMLRTIRDHGARLSCTSCMRYCQWREREAEESDLTSHAASSKTDLSILSTNSLMKRGDGGNLDESLGVFSSSPFEGLWHSIAMSSL